MRLTILFDHRFYRDNKGRVFSVQNYNYPLFESRYLKVFDEVILLARVSDEPHDNPEGRTVEGKNVKIISLGDWNSLFGFIKKSYKIFRILVRYLKKPTAVLMISSGFVGVLGYLYLRLKKIPYAIEVIGDPYVAFAPGVINHPFRPLLRWGFTLFLKSQCFHAAAVSYETKNSLQKRYLSHPEFFSTGCSSVVLSEDAFVPAPRKFNSSQPPFRLLCIGSLAQMYKAPDILLKAIANCEKTGLKLSLRYVGKGKYRSLMENFAEQLGLQESVKFLGLLPAKDDVQRELDNADLFILPSRTEGLPRVILEAMARGLPCISTTVGGIPELLPEDCLVPPDDVDALADKIKEVLRSPARLVEMSLRNHSVAQEYHQDILQQKRMDFYRAIELAAATKFRAELISNESSDVEREDS